MVEDARRVKGKTLRLEVTIWVVRDSQKAIVIGKGGANLKQVGSLARAELEELLETKVFLDIFVKVKKDWRDNDTVLSEMGYELME